MTRTAPFTQAQIKRAIAAAKNAGLRILGIRPDGTVIVYDGKRPIEEALRSALGCSMASRADNEWDSVLGLDDFEGRENEQPTARAAGKPQVPLEGEAWKEHIEKWKEWVRQRPLGVLEKMALRELSAIKGQMPRRIKGVGPGTIDDWRREDLSGLSEK
jgi:hypothetical protein